MTGHLRADLIRLRARWDVRGFLAIVPLIAVLSFVLSYSSIDSHYGYDPAEGMPPELVAMMAAERAAFAFPRSILTALGNLPWVLFGLFFIAAGTLGLEFGWGTIRTVLISSPARGRLVASRLVAVGAIAGYAIGVLVAVGALLPSLMRAAGVEIPAPPATPVLMVVAAVVASALAAALLIAIGAFLAILTRGPALPLLVLLLDFLLESVVAANPVVQDGGLRQFAGSLPLNSLVLLFAGVGDPAAYGLPPLASPSPTDGRPLALSFAVSAGWLVVFLLLTLWRVRRADIVE